MDGEPEAKRVCPSSSIVANQGLLCETESEDAQNGKTVLFVNTFAVDLARAITGPCDDPLGRLAELADSREVLKVPREFYTTYCPDLSDVPKGAESISLDDFIEIVDETLIAHVIDTDDGKMSGRYCIQDLVHIRSTPIYA
jgi:hypothetical protein